MNTNDNHTLRSLCDRIVRPRSVFRLVALFASLLAALSTSAQSPVHQDFANMDLEALLTVAVVTATQHEEDPFSLPFSTSVRTAADLTRLQPRTLPIAFDGLPGLSIQKSAYGQQSPFIRGFTGFRTLLLVDGIRLNNSTFRDGPNQYWTTLDVGAFDRIEVVAGPAAVLYGTDSVGGTAQVFTPVADFASGSRVWSFRTTTRVASAEQSLSGRLAATGPLGPNTQLSAGYSQASFGDYRAGPAVGRVKNSGYRQQAEDLKLEHLFAHQVRLTVAHQSLAMDDVARTHSTIDSVPWAGLTPGTDRQRLTDQTRSLTYARLAIPKLGASVDDVTLTVSHHRQFEESFRERSDGRREIATTDVNAYGLQASARSATRLGLWSYGLAAYRDKVQTGQNRYRADGSFDRRDVQGPVADDSQYDLIGIYAQNQLPQLGRFRLTVRARHDEATAIAGRLLDPANNLPTSFRDTWRSTLGSLNGTYDLPSRAGADLILFAGASQGFRAPNLADLSRLDSVSSGRIETPSVNISPEKYLMNEVGFKMRSKRLSLTATYYYSLINDMIIRRPTGRLVNGLIELAKLNSGEGHVEGAEISLQYALTEQLTLGVVSSKVEGLVTGYPTTNATVTIDEPISRMPPWTNQLSLRFTNLRRTCWAEAVLVIADRQDELSEFDRADAERIPLGGTPGYAAVHLRGGWNPRENLRFTLALENTLDRDYRVHGSGINETGRNVVLSVIFQH